MNLGLESLSAITSSTNADVDMDEVLAEIQTLDDELAADINLEEKRMLLGSVATGLRASKPEDNSLLMWVTEDLQSIGIDCSSNVAAADSIDQFLDASTSNEMLDALIIAGLVALYIAYVVTVIVLLSDLAVWTAAMVTKNEAIIDRGLRTEPKNEDKKIHLLSFGKYMKLMDVMAKSFKVFADNASEFTTTEMNKIHGLMKTIGIPWDGSSYKAVDQHQFVRMTVIQAGWTADACKKGHNVLKDLAVELQVFKTLRKKAEEAAKKAKAYDKKPEATKEENAKAKADAKAKSKDMRLAGTQMKTFVKLAKIIVLNCTFSVQRALGQYAK
jgi:hypothetical protein